MSNGSVFKRRCFCCASQQQFCLPGRASLVPAISCVVVMEIDLLVLVNYSTPITRFCCVLEVCTVNSVYSMSRHHKVFRWHKRMCLGCPLVRILDETCLSYRHKITSSWGANNCWVSHEITRLLWDPDVHCHIHKSQYTTSYCISMQTHSAEILSACGVFRPRVLKSDLRLLLILTRGRFHKNLILFRPRTLPTTLTQVLSVKQHVCFGLYPFEQRTPSLSSGSCRVFHLSLRHFTNGTRRKSCEFERTLLFTLRLFCKRWKWYAFYN
jgi:hypothetical protein